MVEGPVDVEDKELAEVNRTIIKSFLKDVFIHNIGSFEKYVDAKTFTEHSTSFSLLKKATKMVYQKNHRLLAEGNYVLAVTKGL